HKFSQLSNDRVLWNLAKRLECVKLASAFLWLCLKCWPYRSFWFGQSGSNLHALQTLREAAHNDEDVNHFLIDRHLEHHAFLSIDNYNPVACAKLALKPFRQLVAGLNAFYNRKRGRSAAGHQRSRGAICTEKILKQLQQRIF